MGRYKRVPGGLYEEPHPPSLLKFVHLLHLNQTGVQHLISYLSDALAGTFAYKYKGETLKK